MDNIGWAFMVGYLENVIRGMVDKAEADKIIGKAETKAREISGDFVGMMAEDIKVTD